MSFIVGVHLVRGDGDRIIPMMRVSAQSSSIAADKPGDLAD